MELTVHFVIMTLYYRLPLWRVVRWVIMLIVVVLDWTVALVPILQFSETHHLYPLYLPLTTIYSRIYIYDPSISSRERK